MSRDKAEAWVTLAEEQDVGSLGLEKATGLAQVEATLYVGEQMERIADLLINGFRVSAQDDHFNDHDRYIEPLEVS